MTHAFEEINLAYLRRDRRLSGALALLLAILAFALLYLFQLKPPMPPLSETTGVIVNIGVMSGGSGGDDNPDQHNQAAPANQTSQASSPSQGSNLMTNDSKTAPVVPPHSQESDQSNNLPAITPPKGKFSYTKGTTTGGTGTGGPGHSTGTGPGDTPGPGHGPGPGGIDNSNFNFSLSGRSLLKTPDLPQNTCGTFGKVVIRITVDKTGKVLFAIPTTGGTSTSKCLKDLASASAKTALFNSIKDPNASDSQVGTMTFDFTAR